MTKNYNYFTNNANTVLYSLIILFFSACSPRNLVYFSDLESKGSQQSKITNLVEPKIQPNDLLSITVNTLNPESNALFNNGPMQPASNVGSSVSLNNSNFREGYLVDNAGFINFPLVGPIKLSGLTKEEATKKMIPEIKKHVKGEPVVNLRFLNFKVTVMGEVSRPASFTVPTERVNVLEALSMAGDMTQYGKRESVLIVREKDGVRSLTRLNLNSKATFESPYFYLQQNDIVIVEPTKVKGLQSSTNNFYFAKVLAATSAIVLLALRTGLFQTN